MVRSGEQDGFDERVGRIAALGEPIRRALYRYVIASPTPVDREQAAEGVGVARHAAKFHLDRLESDGLLDAEYSRPPGRGGPGAGRPAKRYRRAAREVSVSLPERRYELVGRVMAEAITASAERAVAVDQALSAAASAAGQALGEEANRRAGARPSAAACRRAVAEVLAECGYEPRAHDDGITLVNCPFHGLAQDFTDLVCGTNLDLVNGLVGACERAGLDGRLDPAPERCCVTLTTAPKKPR